MRFVKRKIADLETIINLRSSVLVSAAFLISTALNYGFQIISGRYLGSYKYGLLAGLISVMSITTVALSAFQIQTAKAIAAGKTEQPPKFIDRQLREVTRLAMLISIVLVCLAPIASKFWNIGFLPVLFVCVYIFPAAWDSIAAGRFQGDKNFSGLAGYSLFQSIMKALSLLIVMAIGFGVTSIIGLMTASSTFVALLGIRRNKSLGSLNIDGFDQETRRVLFTNGIFWLMLSMDVIVGRAVLGESAGNYAAASTISKALLWTPALATQILFPHLSSRNVSKEGMSTLVRKGTLFTVVIAISSAFALSFVGPVMVETLYGKSFEGAGKDLWKLCFALVPFSVSQFLISVHFVNGHALLLRVLLTMAIFEGGALMLYGASISSFALIIGITGLLLSIVLVLFGGTADAFFNRKVEA
jgi:O-antigen/teichoic acid export membrane protein